ncbi:MAG: DUF3923 family protein [Companilactobacillus sp.]|nr:DUF3923 family protein [Companilactobacillus sp.]MCH4149887.1 DUF3923 family protein [Companilactobacillus sp.]MCI1409440.1 DUF3923 family protein [Companilactobacillus sp.]MCI1487348.1 DUF3923 family protein [Companilactobacillus sp.]MCI1562363.1 DUF3923 family protein [Companilactobacillus sp.]
MIWAAIFVSGAVFLLVRKYDAAGIYQTTELRLSALAVEGAFLIFIGLCQALAYYFIKRSSQVHHQ